MSLMDRLKGAMGSDEVEREFNYHCRECGTEFETAEHSRSNVECPECGASGTRSLSKL
ncbi:zinc ribbon domain-containing protein [Salinibaculum salinum]|uniref:zinc ribbon domain-containing protein n=1 Tax=Salinibaculum salinum TaxID=3131996 RepID=UPI0030EEA676